MSDKAEWEPSRTGAGEALELLIDELTQDSGTRVPTTSELDPETVAWARRIVVVEQSQRLGEAEELATLDRIWRHVSSSRTVSSESHFSLPQFAQWFSRPWPRVGLVGAAIAIFVAVTLYAWGSRPPAASAEEIVQNARAVATSPLSNGIQSFIISGSNTSRPEKGVVAGLTGNELLVNESKFWYQSPNLWRGESTGEILDEQGKEIPNRAWHMVSASDGVVMWNYDAIKNTAVRNSAPTGSSGPGSFSPFGVLPDMARWNQLVNTCYDPKVTGSATIAGRATYVIDFGPTKCPSASAPELNSRWLIWVDKETFFVLKQEGHSLAGDGLIYESQVTEIQYNVPIDPGEFNFTPPVGASVTIISK